MLMFIYIVYIRPFAKMLYRNALWPEPKINSVAIKTVSRSVSKTAGQRRAKKKTSVRIGRTAKVVKEEDEMLDRGYIFCSDKSLNKCWTGVELSEILQEESLERLRVKINLWAWRQIIIGITKEHLEEIAPFFARDNRGCKDV